MQKAGTLFSLPLIAVAAFAIFLSVSTRNSAAAIVGALVYALAQEALAALVHLDFFEHYLLSDQLDGWNGLFQTPTYWTPVIRAVWVSAIFTAIPLTAPFFLFLRRDVAGE
jgi:ABC-2 type transport system permease protein